MLTFIRNSACPSVASRISCCAGTVVVGCVMFQFLQVYRADLFYIKVLGCYSCFVFVVRSWFGSVHMDMKPCACQECGLGHLRERTDHALLNWHLALRIRPSSKSAQPAWGVLVGPFSLPNSSYAPHDSMGNDASAIGADQGLMWFQLRALAAHVCVGV